MDQENYRFAMRQYHAATAFESTRMGCSTPSCGRELWAGQRVGF